VLSLSERLRALGIAASKGTVRASPHAARVLLPLINPRRLGAAHNILVATRPFSCTNLIFHEWVRRVGASRT
jgi:hypothetical protein